MLDADQPAEHRHVAQRRHVADEQHRPRAAQLQVGGPHEHEPEEPAAVAARHVDRQGPHHDVGDEEDRAEPGGPDAPGRQPQRRRGGGRVEQHAEREAGEGGGVEVAQDEDIVQGDAQQQQRVAHDARARHRLHVQAVLALGLGAGGRGEIEVDRDPGQRNSSRTNVLAAGVLQSRPARSTM